MQIEPLAGLQVKYAVFFYYNAQEEGAVLPAETDRKLSGIEAKANGGTSEKKPASIYT